jgi:DNA-3-methyladenine glycosylase II
MRKPSYWNKAKSILCKKDKVMKKLINSYKDGALETRNDVFFSLCKSIIGQQISVAAANSVFLKFEKSCKGKITAKNVNKLSPSSLKKCGLSRYKGFSKKNYYKRIQTSFNKKDDR